MTAMENQEGNDQLTITGKALYLIGGQGNDTIEAANARFIMVVGDSCEFSDMRLITRSELQFDRYGGDDRINIQLSSSYQSMMAVQNLVTTMIVLAGSGNDQVQIGGAQHILLCGDDCTWTCKCAPSIMPEYLLIVACGQIRTKPVIGSSHSHQ
jgi:Ca2+-binding RTX toxin-like protein